MKVDTSSPNTIPVFTADPISPKYFGGTVSAMKIELVTLQIPAPNPQSSLPIQRPGTESHIWKGTPDMIITSAMYSALTRPYLRTLSADKLPIASPMMPMVVMRIVRQCGHYKCSSIMIPAVL